MHSETKPLHAVYLAMGLLVVGILLPLVLSQPGAGSACAGGALGVLIHAARQMRRAEADADPAS